MRSKIRSLSLAVFLILIFSGFSYAADYTDQTSVFIPSIQPNYSLGAVIIDANNDGAPDIFVANNGQDQLLINNGSGVFSDDTATKLPVDTDYSTGAAAGDVNGDGFDDIFVAANDTNTNQGQNRMLINDGTGIFADQSGTWLPADTRFSSGAAFGKLAGPGGDLFLVIISSISDSSKAIRILRDNNKTAFVDETSSRLTGSTSVFTQKVILADFNRDGSLDILAVNSLQTPNNLLINDGTGHFTEDTTGIIPTDSDSSNSAAVADADNDGFVDYIFIANDGGQQNKLYIYNSTTQKFEDKTSTNLPLDTDNSFDAAFGDLNGDSFFDIFVANGKDTGQLNKAYLNNNTGIFTSADPAFFPADTDFSTGVIIANLDGSPGNEVFVTNAFDQQNRLYSAGPVVTTYSISGTVTLSGGSGVVTDATVTLSGAKDATANPGSDGKYTFSGLEAGVDYTVTPTLTGYTFTPASKDFTNLSKNETQDFSGSSTTLEITTTSLPDGTVGVVYSAAIEVVGGTLPYKWTKPSGLLPAGLKLDKSTGVISGTPKGKKSKTFKFKVTVKDSSKPKKKSVSKKFTITINK